MSATDPGGLVGLRDVVLDHARRLNGIEERERRVVEELQNIRASLWPLKLISWVFTAAGAAFITFVVVAVLKMFSVHVPEAPPVPWPGERMGSDQIPAPKKGDNGQ